MILKGRGPRRRGRLLSTGARQRYGDASRRVALDQLLRGEAEAVNGRKDAGTLFLEEALAIGAKQSFTRGVFYEHSETPAPVDEVFLHELLIGFHHREGIDPVFRGDVAHRR